MTFALTAFCKMRSWAFALIDAALMVFALSTFGLMVCPVKAFALSSSVQMPLALVAFAPM